MPRRAAESSKNDYGRILCVCGSAGYTGAAFFAAQGAVRMGSGVVTLAVPERAWPVLAVKLSEPVVRPLPCTEDGLFSVRALPRLLELAEHADALLIGCGLGRSDEVTEVVCTMLRERPRARSCWTQTAYLRSRSIRIYCAGRPGRSS